MKFVTTNKQGQNIHMKDLCTHTFALCAAPSDGCVRASERDSRAAQVRTVAREIKEGMAGGGDRRQHLSVHTHSRRPLRAWCPQALAHGRPRISIDY